MKIKKLALTILTIISIMITGCHFTNEYTFKDIKFSVSREYEHEHTENAEIFRKENAEIVIKQGESELRRLVNDDEYIESYDAEFETESTKVNDIYYAVTYMERSELKGGTVRFKSIEYSFSVSGKNYIISVTDVIDVIDIEPLKQEIEYIVESMDVSWEKSAFPQDMK